MRIHFLCTTIVAVLLVTAAPVRAAEAVPDVSAALQQLHDDVRSATARHDRAALERLFADEYVFVHTTGGAELKADYITRLLTTQPGMAGAVPVQEEVHQQVYGDVVVRTARVAAKTNPIWWTWVYVKRDGRWQIARQHGTAVAEQRASIAVSPESLAIYAGKYQTDSGSTLDVRVDGQTLIAQSPGRPEITLLPEGDSRFHLKDGSTIFTFTRGDKGEVTGVVMKRASGVEITGKRVRE